MTPEELLSYATAFELGPFSGEVKYLKIELRRSREQINRWAIVDDGYCLNHEGDWEYERLPSSREDDFLVRCRWDDLYEAVDFVIEHMKQYPSGSKFSG